MKSIFNFHFRIKWTIFMLFQLLFILASVHCIKDRNLNSFSEVLNSGLKNDTNPCNDFYHYACGKWIESHELHDTFEKWNVDIMAGLTTIKLIKEILEDPNIDENNEELSAERKFYNACINEDYSRDEGLKLFRNIVGTPQTSWQETVKYFTNLSFFDLFHIKLTENNYLQVERPQFSESNRRPFSETSPETTDRVKFIYKALDIDMRLRIQQVYESLDFIESVNEITLNGEEDIQEVSILQLQEMYDNHCPSKHAKIEWIKFFKSLAKGTRAVFKNDSQLIVDVQYLKDLCEQLSKTPEHAIVNYLKYNFIFNKNIVFYIRTDLNQMKDTERSIRCIRNLKITDGVTNEIVKLYIPGKSQKIVHEMFNNIKSELIKEVENSWLINKVKKVAVNIAKRMEYRYGVVDDYFESKFGKKVTYKFEVGRIALQNELNLRKAQIINILEAYEETDKLYREKRFTEANACYIAASNDFVVGVAMMFPPVFYESAPIGFNYGRIGFTIGHEISHAFDFAIMQNLIDCIPSKRERKMVESMLEKRKNCFVNEFDSFRVDGLRTLHENVADTQGLKLAWKAMNAVIEDQQLFQHLNQKRLFFLSFANQWCSNPEYREDDGEDEHAPSVIRALGTLKNMNEFAETYRCTNESMNPKTKCDWWAKSSTNRFKKLFEKLKTFFRKSKTHLE